MAAYNTGEGRVLRSMKISERNGKNTDYYSIKLPRETRNYVPSIIAMAIIYKNPERFGFEHVNLLKPMDETKASIDVAFSLEEVAKRSKISFRF